MAKFILEVEDGASDCATCPFSFWDCGDYACSCGTIIDDSMDCQKVNFSTIKVTKIEE